MCTTYDVEHLWCLYYHSEFLGVWRSILQYFNLRDTLQRMNSVVQLACFNCYSRYRGLLSLEKSDLFVIILQSC